MKSLRIALTTLCLLTSVITCLGQGKWYEMSNEKSKKHSDNAHAGSSQTGKFDHKEKITATYDKFKDITTLKLQSMEVGEGVYLYALAMCSGMRLPSSTDNVHFLFSLHNNSWQCLNGCGVTFLINGKRVSFGVADHVDRKVGGAYGVQEVVAIEVPYDLFLTIASSSDVEVQAGRDEFTLKTKHKEALRDFASRMRQR